MSLNEGFVVASFFKVVNPIRNRHCECVHVIPFHWMQFKFYINLRDKIINFSNAHSINFFMKKQSINQKNCQGTLGNEKISKTFLMKKWIIQEQFSWVQGVLGCVLSVQIKTSELQCSDVSQDLIPCTKPAFALMMGLLGSFWRAINGISEKSMGAGNTRE